MTMTNNKLGVYIHIPYCIRRCPYCGFYSKALSPNLPNLTEVSCVESDQHKDCEETDCPGKHTGAGYYKLGFLSDSFELKNYKERLLKEIKDFVATWVEGNEISRQVDSIFFGGGTPSLMPPDYFSEIIRAIKDIFSLNSDSEITMEANPGTFQTVNKVFNGEFSEADVMAERLKSYIEAGINRLSLGIQSFDDEVLSTLGRIHTAKEAEETYRAARTAGFDNINLDLMFGIPGQSLKQWEVTLKKTIELNPEHISFYSLQIEEGTPYYERFQKGEFDELPEETDRLMYHTAIAMLKNAGYKHYEISNVSKPGFECRHNLKYWTGREYVGFGDSASSYIGGIRYTMMNGEKTDVHINSKFDDMSEYTFTGLRLTSGINYGEFKSRFGIGFREAFSDRWNELKDFFDSKALIEYVDKDGTPVSLVITEKGMDISNRIMMVFV